MIWLRNAFGLVLPGWCVVDWSVTSVVGLSFCNLSLLVVLAAVMLT